MDLLEIEKQLSSPNAKEALASYDATLIALSQRLKQAMDEGLQPQEFTKCQHLADAIVTARKLLRLKAAL